MALMYTIDSALQTIPTHPSIPLRDTHGHFQREDYEDSERFVPEESAALRRAIERWVEAISNNTHYIESLIGTHFFLTMLHFPNNDTWKYINGEMRPTPPETNIVLETSYPHIYDAGEALLNANYTPLPLIISNIPDSVSS